MEPVTEESRRRVLGENAQQGDRPIHALRWDSPERFGVGIQNHQTFPKAVCGHRFYWFTHLTKRAVTCKNCLRVLAKEARKRAEEAEHGVPRGH